MRKLTTEEFIEKAIKVHGDRYDYNLVNYIGNSKKVFIKCNLHSVFEQTPANHLSGYNCKSCADISSAKGFKNYMDEKKSKYDAIEINNTTVTLTIKNNFKFTIDLQDYDKVRQHTWWENKNGYLCTDIRGKRLLLHRFILGVNDSEVHIDHINGIRHINTRSNLRLCSHAENSRNSKPSVGKTSIYKGVSWDKERSKWVANICYEGKNKYLGRYVNEIECAIRYDSSAKELFGEFAWLNFKNGK